MAALSVVKLCVLQVLVEYLLTLGPPTFLILSFYALYLQLPFIEHFFCPPRGISFFYSVPLFSSPSGEICWILLWCFVNTDLWAIIPKFWCVLTCCNNSPWLNMLNVLEGVLIIMGLLLLCSSSFLSVCIHKAVCLGSNVIILTFLGRMSSLRITDYN